MCDSLKKIGVMRDKYLPPTLINWEAVKQPQYKSVTRASCGGPGKVKDQTDFQSITGNRLQIRNF